MNFLIKISIISFLIITCCKSSGRRDPDGSPNALKPNIILVMTDDQGWYDVGFNGNKEVRTPNLDKMASEGTIFDRFYSGSAVCSPTRASVITGRNPLRMDIPNANAGHMKDQEITLPEILQKAGYNTGHFGKWHLGILTKLTKDANRGGRDQNLEHYSIPTMNGCDEYFCTESKVPTYDSMVCPLVYDEGESLRYGWKARGNKELTKPMELHTGQELSIQKKAIWMEMIPG